MTSSDVQRQFPYRPRWSTFVLGVAFFGGGALICDVASRDDRELVLQGVIRLSREDAALFWKVVGFVCLAFVAGAVLGAYLRLASKQRIAFGPTSVMVPKSRWSNVEIEIPFRDVVAVSESETAGVRTLRVTHAGGTSAIASSMLPSMDDFVEVRRLLTVGFDAARSDQPPRE